MGMIRINSKSKVQDRQKSKASYLRSQEAKMSENKLNYNKI